MGNTSNDLISVIIPFYNEEDYFENCIFSVLRQTYNNIEVIIVNDGSKLVYKEKLDNLQKLQPNKIKVLHHPNNLGVSAARNTGIDAATGKYIAFLDADDEWLPHKLEHQLNLMRENKLNYIHGSYYNLDENENFKGILLAENMNYKTLINSCDIGLSTVMILSSICKNIKFEISMTTKEDYVYWLKLSKILTVLHGDKKLVSVYRNKNQSLSNSIFIKFKNAFLVYYKFEKQNPFIAILSVLRLSAFWLIKQKKIVGQNIYPLEIRYVKKIENINYDKSFILVALNMASLAYMKLLYLNLSKIIFWLDGYTASFVIEDFKKIPGREIIRTLDLPNNIQNIYLCGKYSEQQLSYLKKKFNHDIIFKEIPMLNFNKDIAKQKINFENNSAVMINIATPKQEILAQSILKKNIDKKLFIFCLGGGIAMACGEEEFAPPEFERLNLEWLWRLKTNTWFRLKRLIFTAFVFFTRKITFFYRKFNFTQLIK